MAISGAKTVLNNASMDYWDQSGDYYTILGGTYNYLTGISASATSVPSTGWSSTACLGNGNTISTEKSTLSVTLSVTKGTYTAAYYTNSQGSSGDMMVWWKQSLVILDQMFYGDKIIKNPNGYFWNYFTTSNTPIIDNTNNWPMWAVGDEIYLQYDSKTGITIIDNSNGSVYSSWSLKEIKSNPGILYVYYVRSMVTTPTTMIYGGAVNIISNISPSSYKTITLS